MPGNLNAWRRIGLKWSFFRCFPAIPTTRSAGNVTLWDVKRLLRLRASLFHANLWVAAVCSDPVAVGRNF